ncbi:nicotinate-nucleotide adenylyltransferase [Alkalihalobacterium chitinilyticum]|uniref:Probable nicotinate-nucleotide adenylyltransferase n=1 Tax=Alkalihalobacterium chitinilyticum TaxID=2980103 RepID=A0ABT5VEF4_9BACI|nr:nicotinate-nucleotide adenylyltransferase [Alkalihalobacterium chitinilyticum]MDE5413843.1 nicotinate-nucleotide adenylyltransferase [Alkalihalobacterium chitinilyticum]
MRKIGILGGTFDPPHIGHLLIAQEVLEQCKLDEIWFMPANIPPHKKNDEVSSVTDRIEMVTKAIEGVEQFTVSTVELERNGPSYTVDTLKELKMKLPDVEFYFIIGGDMIEQLHTWERIDELFEYVTFVGLQRPGYSQSSKYAEKLQLLTIPQVDISSSDIRERLKEGRGIRYFVPEQVRQFIEERQLYGTSASVRNR